MPAHVGILSPYLTPPTGACLTRSTRKKSREVAKLTLHDGTGKTKKAVQLPLITITSSISGKGVVDLTTLSPGAVVSGTVTLTSIKQEEMNTDFPGFDMEGITYA